ncbi:hypothetical protein ACR82Z_01505 [Mycoplasma sp. 6243]|uniref:hypothetical protein n=1 Tax=Mycoplasma sp. 6243 TaxID=3440865 RepID=UPI003EBEBE74
MYQILTKFDELNKENKLSHLYLFKTNSDNVDNFLLQLINIINNTKFAPDTSLSKLTNNIYLIDGSKDIIKKDDVQAVVYQAQFQQNNNQKTIIIIKDIDHTTHITINSFLKFIEEPNDNTIIFATTSKINKVLPTIISRSQIINLIPFLKKPNKENWYQNFSENEQHIVILKQLITYFEQLLQNNSKYTLNLFLDFLNQNLKKENIFFLNALKYLFQTSNLLNYKYKELDKIYRLINRKTQNIRQVNSANKLMLEFNKNLSDYNSNFEMQKVALLIKLRRLYE